MKDLKHIKRFNESEENSSMSDFNSSNSFDDAHEDSYDVMEKVIEVVKPFYKKHGLEETKDFFQSILDGIHDIGGEYFGD